MSAITTHVLDLSTGTPASGLKVQLGRLQVDAFCELARAVTDADGRVRGFEGVTLTPGVYRLQFAVAAYFDARGISTFYPQVDVVFRVDDARSHHHVPLLLSPFGYSTYRGS